MQLACPEHTQDFVVASKALSELRQLNPAGRVCPAGLFGPTCSYCARDAAVACKAPSVTCLDDICGKHYRLYTAHHVLCVVSACLLGCCLVQGGPAIHLIRHDLAEHLCSHRRVDATTSPCCCCCMKSALVSLGTDAACLAHAGQVHLQHDDHCWMCGIACNIGRLGHSCQCQGPVLSDMHSGPCSHLAKQHSLLST